MLAEDCAPNLPNLLDRGMQPDGGGGAVETGCKRVLGDVAHCGGIVLRIANDAVPGLMLPQRASASEGLVDSLAAAAFPGGGQRLERVSGPWTAKHVRMVWHDGVGQHFHSLTITMVEGLHQERAVFGMPQEALTEAFVEQEVELPGLALIEGFQGLRFRCRELSVWLASGDEALTPVFCLCLHAAHDLCRQGVAQTKGAEIAGSRLAPVGKMACVTLQS